MCDHVRWLSTQVGRRVTTYLQVCCASGAVRSARVVYISQLLRMEISGTDREVIV